MVKTIYIGPIQRLKGKTARIKCLDSYTVLAQFDDTESHGWFPFPRIDFIEQ